MHSWEKSTYSKEKEGQRYRYPEPNQMPILFENYQIMVFENGSGEIFVETKSDPPVRARITPRPRSLAITAGNGGGILTPTSVNGLPAFVVRHP